MVAFLAEQVKAQKEQQLKDEAAEKESKALGLTRTPSSIAIKPEPGDKMDISPEDGTILVTNW